MLKDRKRVVTTGVIIRIFFIILFIGVIIAVSVINKIKENNDTVVFVKEEQSSDNYTSVEEDNHTLSEEDYNSSTYQTVTDDDILGEVWGMAQSFVKDKLKSPSSADFPVYGDSNVSITNSGDYYKVVGYVDAENGFGAETRSTFSLVLKKSGNNYTLKECNID